MLLGTTPDPNRLFKLGDDEDPKLAILDPPVKVETFGSLLCEELLYAALPTQNANFRLEGMLPGQPYYLMLRGVSVVGKGEFSDILGPYDTDLEGPGDVEPLEVSETSEHSCKLRLRLPYNMGAPIESVRVVVKRRTGPLSADELRAETGECQEHIARQEFSLAKSELRLVPSSGSREPTRLAGSTGALVRACEVEGLTQVGSMAWSTGHTPTLLSCTGLVYEFEVGAFRPGNEYEATWGCGNGIGMSRVSAPTGFLTCATVPDTPVPMTFPSM